MDIFEQAVMDYCAATPGRLVSPQLHIAFDQEAKVGGSMPDLIVLDFSRSTIYVIEVTSASNPKKKLERVYERETRWFGPLHRSFSRMHAPFSQWGLRVTLFLRDEICADVSRDLHEARDVSVISLDRVMFPWRWNYQGQVPMNPLE